LIGIKGVLNDYIGKVFRNMAAPVPGHEGSSCPHGHGGPQEVMAIKTFTTQGYKQVARLEGAAIGAYLLETPLQRADI
jgi:hypothetical protein